MVLKQATWAATTEADMGVAPPSEPYASVRNLERVVGAPTAKIDRKRGTARSFMQHMHVVSQRGRPRAERAGSPLPWGMRLPVPDSHVMLTSPAVLVLAYQVGVSICSWSRTATKRDRTIVTIMIRDTVPSDGDSAAPIPRWPSRRNIPPAKQSYATKSPNTATPVSLQSAASTPKSSATATPAVVLVEPRLLSTDPLKSTNPESWKKSESSSALLVTLLTASVCTAEERGKIADPVSFTLVASWGSRRQRRIPYSDGTRTAPS